MQYAWSIIYPEFRCHSIESSDSLPSGLQCVSRQPGSGFASEKGLFDGYRRKDSKLIQTTRSRDVS